MQDGDVWLTQNAIAQLFDIDRSVVSKHLKKIFSSGELDENSVCAKYAQTADDGKNYNYKFYSLAAIIAVGYRTNSDKATQFRQWATKVLDAFTKQGYVLDKSRLVNGKKFDAKYHLSEGTKTIAGNRKVPFDKKVAAAFEMERKILKEKRISCNQIIDGYTDFVFLNKDGKIFNQTSINRALSRIVDAYNGYVEREGLENRVLPHLTTHCLRHSYAIILCERGVNVKVMQMLLGHKDISTTMDIYTKISEKYVLREYSRVFMKAT